MVIAALLAGGSGSRMGAALPKQFLKINGVPVLVHSLRAFVQSGLVDACVVSVPTDYIEMTRALAAAEGTERCPVTVIAGGATRSGTLLGLNARILRDGVEIARAESTSQYPHEEDAEQHKVAAKIPAQGFYRVWTREQNLDLLFVTLLAFARSGATDDAGGSRKALFNTLRK